ncbi:4'-phosphopantetheinyl transferase superfamily protein [Streptomyces sp. CNQ085]|uniref:4'-phosphopantetheinyl transferase family protein n=1 Tax=Streptomyces sp. CNQ085 TaxID=2886944 RepID=UPI001F505023|nr:4'-phosphopantetheinyl transferase superfamily protein [Streptomyces sp. CNQ085]MCI0385818.1 4'-phosphopantetheinyl transferase superfamily protein [Streptomyces sp. CNQ085]
MTEARTARPGEGAGRADQRTQLWLLAEESVDAEVARYAAGLLSADERRRLERLRPPAGRRRFLGARLLCRTVLGELLGQPPAALRFVRGALGRPELDPGPHGVRFSVSHTSGLIGCLVSREGPCGLDVERAEVSGPALRYGQRWLAPAERELLAALPPGRRAREFTDLWVLKEAYTKALGLGFQHRFDGFRLGPDDHGQVVLEDPSVPPDAAARWRFALLSVSGGHRLAVAVRRDDDGCGPWSAPRPRYLDPRTVVAGAGR